MLDATAENGERPRLRFRGSAIVVLFACCAVYVLRAGGPVLVPLLVSLLAAYALEPFVSLLSVRARLPRLVSVAVLYRDHRDSRAHARTRRRDRRLGVRP